MLAALVLSFSSFLGTGAGTAQASYINTNMNTFIHDSADTQIGYPGQEMQMHVRIGYNGANGLYNPVTDEIQNVRVRLSNDQNYLTTNEPGSSYKKSNPYGSTATDDSSGDNERADVWEEGYQAGKSYAYNNKLNYVYPVDGGVYPFEINASLFTQEQAIGTLKKGEYVDLTFNVTVRNDALTMKDNDGNTSDGYFGIPFTIWYEVPQNSTGAYGKFNKTEFINVYIEKTGDIKDSSEKTKDTAFVIGENQSTPNGTYPNVMNFGVNFRNQTGRTLYDVQVHMKTSLDEKADVQTTANPKSEASRAFPFEINEANYDREYERVEAGAVITPEYSMAIKKNAASAYYPLSYEVSYKQTPSATTHITETYTFYVNVGNSTMVNTDSTLGDFNENDRTKARLIVDAYHTEPEEVYAGEPFTLVFTMKNASASINASNILLSLESDKANDAAVFSMEGGANSIVLNSLAAGESKELRVQMTAAAGVDPKSYAVTINEKYDSPEFKNASEKVTVDVPVKQLARLGCSSFDVSPASIEVGGDANVTFGINNTGKVTLYNVEAEFAAPSIKSNTSYVGNVKSGETGNVDVMLTGAAVTEDDGTIPVIIHYEDVNGKSYTEETSINLMVTEPAEEEYSDADMTKEDDRGSSVPMLLGGLAVLLGAACGIVIYFVRRSRKKREEDETI